MASSSSFGSNSLYSIALLGLAFATPTSYDLSLHNKINSPTHYTKGTLSLPNGALTACRHSISVSISLPLSGFFSPFPHGTSSLSVIKEYLGLDELVHPRNLIHFRQDFTCPALLEPDNLLLFIRDYHPLWLTFPGYSN